jgi:predicted metal-binding protein
MREILENCVFCPGCDYAISRAEYDQMRNVIAFHTCPRCKEHRISNFYSYGSTKHKERREAFLRGEIVGNPVFIEGGK